MAAPLARVKAGINLKSYTTFWYVEARFAPGKRWMRVTDGKRWTTHRTRAAAEHEAAELAPRLRAKLEASV